MNFRHFVPSSLLAVSVAALPISAMSFPSTLLKPSTKNTPPALLAQSPVKNPATQEVYGAFEREVLAEINRARTNPGAYAEKLESLRQYYDGDILSLPDEDSLRTREGLTALDEAIEFLRSQQPLPALTFSSGMSNAARDHARDLGEGGRSGNVGSDGSQPGDRLKRYGAWSGGAIELISYGKRTATAVVTLMILNDGNPNRGLRAELFSPDYQFVGVSCGFHATQATLCVMDYAVNYTESGTVTARSELAERPTIGPDSTPVATQAISSAAAQVPASSDTQVEPIDTSVEPEAGSTRTPTPSVSKEKVLVPAVAGYLSQLEQGIITETNRLRQNPTAYAEELEKLKQFYEGNLLNLPGVATVETQEGIAALEEAIAVLHRTKPLPLLTPSRGMSLGARDHAKDLGSSGNSGHGGSDGSSPFDRISRYGTWAIVAGENISYSPINTAQWHIIQLLIDDGVPDRGHRKALLKPDYNVTGVACGDHPVLGNVCVMTYAGKYQDKETGTALQQ
jgi:uncharacterized protein YkwD